MFKPTETTRRRRPYVRQFYRNNRGLLVLGVLSALLMAAVNLVLSWMIQQLIDVTVGGVSTFSFPVLVAMTVGLVGLVLLMSGLRYLSIPRFLARAMHQYKNYAFSELTKKNLASFATESTSTYVSALSNDTTSIETNYLQQIFALVTQSLLFIGAFSLMIYYSPMLTLAAVAFAFLPVIASILTGRRLTAKEQAVSDRNESYTATLKDALSGFSVVKSFKAEDAIRLLYEEGNKRLETAKLERRKTSTLITMIGAIAGIIAQMGVFLVGAYLALSGRGVTPGIVIAFVNLMNFVIQPIGEVPEILANRKAAYSLIDKLAKALSTQVRNSGTDIDAVLERGIQLQHLGFAYEPEQPVLTDVSVTLEKNKSYAIVGPSGSGKSTLLKLLMGASNDYQGSIRYDEHELRAISTESLYDLVSLVQQDVFIFNASIRDNITMFAAFDPCDIEEAIRKSGLAPLIASKGEDYLCGENGANLSGGERQRIAIARSLLRKTPVLFVDEATSSLDNETASHVTQSILDLNQLTRVVVTHRFDEQQLKRYDQILTLKDGQLVESGSFTELMSKKGFFYSLYVIGQE